MATKRPSQSRITAFISRTKRPALNEDSSDSEEDIETNSTCATESEQVSTCNESACTADCCIDLTKVYQPTNKVVLESLFNQRNFRSEWFKQYPWLTVCLTKRKVFCLPCRYTFVNKLLTFSKNCSPAFIEDGFNNWRKATKRFHDHEGSLSHQEAEMKMIALERPALPQLFNDQIRQQQQSRRKSLLTQLSCLRYLLRQGLAIRGHNDDRQGNLKQLLLMMSHETDSSIVDWLREKNYMSPDIVNEQITMLGQSVLRTLLSTMKRTDPCWYAVIADEATDVRSREQLNLSLRWVNDEYDVSEDPVGLFVLPNTTADTITSVIKDLLIRCNMPLSLCRGQAYDGAATMQGVRKGVATQIRRENPTALPVHCFAHSLNLCLQDAGRQILSLRDSLDTVREIGKLIKFSPKRSHLFNQKLIEADSESVVTIKSLSTTRWTARTSAIEAVLKDYPILMETMTEINNTTHDEYGLKAAGILASLEKFSTLFGLKLGYILFAAAEQVSKSLQAKDTTLQEALSSVNLAASFYRRQRTVEAFDRFYDDVVAMAEDLNIGEPVLPRQRRPPARIDSGSEPHRFSSPREYYRRLYYEACDLL